MNQYNGMSEGFEHRWCQDVHIERLTIGSRGSRFSKIVPLAVETKINWKHHLLLISDYLTLSQYVTMEQHLADQQTTRNSWVSLESHPFLTPPLADRPGSESSTGPGTSRSDLCFGRGHWLEKWVPGYLILKFKDI